MTKPSKSTTGRKNKGESSGTGKREGKEKFKRNTLVLKEEFQKDDRLDPERRDMLALKLGIQPGEVKNFFMYRSTKGKNSNGEEEIARLRAEVEFLNDQLRKAEMTIHILGNILSNNSPTSSTAADPALVENEFGREMIKEYLLFDPASQ